MISSPANSPNYCTGHKALRPYQFEDDAMRVSNRMSYELLTLLPMPKRIAAILAYDGQMSVTVTSWRSRSID